MFSEEQLSEIRERLSIVEFIGEFVQLKKAGKNHKGLCPFHQEKSPSFIVSPDRDTFHCFGCGAGGNLFHFLMKLESLSFPEAVERLAERAGVQVASSGPADPHAKERRDEAFEIHRQAAWYYHCLLKNTPKEHEIWAYLAKRQISDEAIEAFHIGYCPSQESGLAGRLQQKGFKREALEKYSIYRGRREFFRGRLTFPIFRHDKKVVGLGGRLFQEKDEGPKYLNSPESEIFKKGELFYGFHLAKAEIRKKNQVLLVEGYLDVITLHGQGFSQALAPLGTALTPMHAKTLQRQEAEVILLFDGDSAGEEAGLRALEVLLAQGVIPQIVRLDGGEDPDSYLKRFGRLAFEKKLQERRNLLEELIDKWSASLPRGPQALEQRGRVARRLLALIEKIPDSIVQNLYRRRLSEGFDIPEEWLRGNRAFQDRRPVATPRPARLRNWLPEEETLVEVWLRFPSLRPEILQAVEAEDFCTEELGEVVRSFWELAKTEPYGKTGKYLELVPESLLEMFTELTLRPDGLDEVSTAKLSLDEAVVRLKERRLKEDLQALRGSANPQAIHVVHEKIQALSQVLKNKARIYGERKN
ncbi:MAG: DNA primase [Deltaproteobacteria bacterium]|nr:DNA primase [Deltaproteobacteria bacterium]